MTSPFPDPLEDEIQIQVADLLRLFEKSRGFVFTYIANELLGKAQTGAGIGRMVKAMRMGLRDGAADFIIGYKGRAYWLEMKRRSGTQSTNQLEFEADCIRAGTEYAVAHSYDEAEKILRIWQIIP